MSMKNMKKLFLLSPLGFLINAASASAHCPLCTMGAVVVAGGAAYLGVSSIVIGLFIGAFAASLGLWIARVVKKKKEYIKFQSPILFLVIYLSTILPIMPFMGGIHPLYISWFGDYGSLFNRTYLLNIFLIGAILGGSIMSIMPWVSGKITVARKGKMLFPYQGMVLTLIILLILGGILQLIGITTY